MGKRGPAPEPSIIKYIRGNPGKRSLNGSEPTPEEIAENFPPPSYLSGDGLEKWNSVIPILISMRVMTEADTETIGRYCAIWAEWKKNYEMVKKNGDVLTIWEADPNDPTGKKQRVKYMQPTPYATQMKSLATVLLRIEQEFGLTPSSRSQVSIHGRTEDDPLASFVKERGRVSGA
jgi:P27 family predicted phage terminase small subunit